MSIQSKILSVQKSGTKAVSFYIFLHSRIIQMGMLIKSKRTSRAVKYAKLCNRLKGSYSIIIM
jgi:hypothetical protein